MNLIRCCILIGLFVLIISVTAMATEVSKEDWVNGMTTALPAYFCKDDQYFRQCFRVTRAECEETSLSTARLCLKQYKDAIPVLLKQPEDGSKWGAAIGTCAGMGYEIALQEKRINSDKCNDPNNWTK